MATIDRRGKRDLTQTNLVLSSEEYHQKEFPYHTLVGDKQYTIPPRWFDAALAILDLPIPTYSAPLAIYGEINNVTHAHALVTTTLERENTMNDYDDVMNRLGNVKPVDQRDPFLSEGQHQLLVHSFQNYNDSKWGRSVRVLFLVEQSTKHPPGSLVARTYNVNKPAAYATQSNDADSLADLICVMQGIKLGEHHNSAKALLVAQQSGGQYESQVARGMRINATGYPPGNGLTAAGKPKTYTKITWQTAPNDAASVAANRAMLDAKFPIGAPAPQAPTQMQPVQQYIQTGMNPAHQMYQPPSQSYTMQPQPVTVQPPYTPPQQVPPQGYAQPVFGQQPVQGAPTGGFLAMLPPKP